MGYTDKRDRKRKHNFVVKDGVAMRKTEDNNKYNPDPDFIVFLVFLWCFKLVPSCRLLDINSICFF